MRGTGGTLVFGIVALAALAAASFPLDYSPLGAPIPAASAPGLAQFVASNLADVTGGVYSVNASGSVVPIAATPNPGFLWDSAQPGSSTSYSTSVAYFTARNVVQPTLYARVTGGTVSTQTNINCFAVKVVPNGNGTAFVNAGYYNAGTYGYLYNSPNFPYVVGAKYALQFDVAPGASGEFVVTLYATSYNTPQQVYGNYPGYLSGFSAPNGPNALGAATSDGVFGFSEYAIYGTNEPPGSVVHTTAGGVAPISNPTALGTPIPTPLPSVPFVIDYKPSPAAVPATAAPGLAQLAGVGLVDVSGNVFGVDGAMTLQSASSSNFAGVGVLGTSGVTGSASVLASTDVITFVAGPAPQTPIVYVRGNGSQDYRINLTSSGTALGIYSDASGGPTTDAVSATFPALTTGATYALKVDSSNTRQGYITAKIFALLSATTYSQVGSAVSFSESSATPLGAGLTSFALSYPDAIHGIVRLQEYTTVQPDSIVLPGSAAAAIVRCAPSFTTPGMIGRNVVNCSSRPARRV